MNAAQRSHDVIIAGGGPAGSTAATLLAQHGHSVLLLEKERHPRFHIGESMMPYIEPVMQRLGMDWGEGNLRKSGADFIDEESGRQLFFSLQNRYGTYQLERCEFDRKLFDNAIAHGVEGHQQEKVLQADCSQNGVEVRTERGVYQGRYFIDASGRSALLGRKQKSIQRLENLGRFALYRHFQVGHSPEIDAVFATGNIKILLADIGWLWLIPMTGRRFSIGLVVQQDKPKGVAKQELLQQYIDASPLLITLLKDACPVAEMQVEADFSYINQRRYGQRYACCGDAAGFLDPVFSSGVFFAVKTAEFIADRVHLGLRDNNEADPQLHAVDDEKYQIGFKTMHLLIERFYRSRLIHNLVFEADRHPRIKQEVTALLAGDLWQEDNMFQQGLLRGRRSKG